MKEKDKLSYSEVISRNTNEVSFFEKLLLLFKKEHSVKIKCECGKEANGRYYYPYLRGFWKYQCSECAHSFQAFEPSNNNFKGDEGMTINGKIV